MDFNSCYEFNNRYARIYYDICKQDDKDKNLIIYYLDNQKVLTVWCNDVGAIIATVAKDVTIPIRKKYIDVDL